MTSDGDHIVIYELPDSELSSMSARVSRTATLDGGVVITHSGFAHGDRTLRIRAEVTEAEAAVLQNIHQTETFVWVSTKDGFFSGAIERVNNDGGLISMSLLIKEKLS